MKKPVVLRRRADTDIDQALEYYALNAPNAVARLVDTLQTTLTGIGRVPRIGSGRFAQELEVPDLRHRHVRRYPYLVFYMETADEIAILRVLHHERAISLAFAESP